MDHQIIQGPIHFYSKFNSRVAVSSVSGEGLSALSPLPGPGVGTERSAPWGPSLTPCGQPAWSAPSYSLIPNNAFWGLKSQSM